MDAIVYTSDAGHTKQYAEMLSKKTGLHAYALSDSKAVYGQEVLYLGWIMAGNVKGLKKAARLFRLSAVCAVGMAEPNGTMAEETRRKNSIPCETFYLQGGFNLQKLHGLNRLMMKMMSKSIAQSLEKKENRTPSDDRQISMLKNGLSCVSEENLSQVLSWYAGRKHTDAESTKA